MWLLSVKLVWMLIAADPGLAAPKMVLLPGGRFEMGCTDALSLMPCLCIPWPCRPFGCQRRQ